MEELIGICVVLYIYIFVLYWIYYGNYKDTKTKMDNILEYIYTQYDSLKYISL